MCVDEPDVAAEGECPWDASVGRESLLSTDCLKIFHHHSSEKLLLLQFFSPVCAWTANPHTLRIEVSSLPPFCFSVSIIFCTLFFGQKTYLGWFCLFSDFNDFSATYRPGV